MTAGAGTFDNATPRRSIAPLRGSVRVRRATQADIGWLLVQLQEFAAWYGTSRSLFGDVRHAEALVGTLIETQFVAIAETDDGRVGLIAGACAPHVFNPDMQVATELWWWVTPPARGTRAGALLLDAFETWADDSGANLVNFTLEAQSPVAERTLEKRGYRLMEKQFVREVS